MDKHDVQKIVELRQDLITKFNRLRDYKNNPNAIMKEVDHARMLNDAIQRIDSILSEHVTFRKDK